ncbi:MAG: hypothetical protein AAGF11_44550 [Myxococcota bacterium]
MSSFAPLRVSEEEYLAQAETMERMELVDGELWIPPASPRIHQHVIGQLYRQKFFGRDRIFREGPCPTRHDIGEA